MNQEAAETITKIMMTLPQLSEASQMRLLGVAEGMEIALAMQRRKDDPDRDKKEGMRNG